MEKEVPKRYRNKPAFIEVSLEEAARLHSEEGFDLTIREMEEIFDASETWIRKNWIPYVKHIYYPCEQVMIWFSRPAFWKRFEENAIAYYQRRPDTPPRATEKECEQFLGRYAVRRSGIPWERTELPRDKDGDYIVGKSIRGMQEWYREQLDRIDKDGILKNGTSREAVLRRLYVRGAIKISIFGKVFWALGSSTQQ